MKTCSLCKKEKSLDEFILDKYKKSGRTSRCKQCVREKYSEKNFPRIDSGKKVCMHCKIDKEYIEFGSNKANKDGLNVWCKICARKKSTEYRHRTPEAWERERHQKFVNWREKLGIPVPIKIKGKKGEGYINRQGYLSFKRKDHPCADKNGRVQASHLVVYEHTGRILKKGESVHHKNGHRLDNSIENLEVWSTSQPSGQRIEDKINWCIEFLIEQEYDVKKRDYNE